MNNLMTVHFVERMQERYGISVSDDDAQKIITLILKGFGKFKGTNLSRSERYLVGFKGKLVDVIYDPIDNMLITAYSNRQSHTGLPLRVLLDRFVLRS